MIDEIATTTAGMVAPIEGEIPIDEIMVTTTEKSRPRQISTNTTQTAST